MVDERCKHWIHTAFRIVLYDGEGWLGLMNMTLTVHVEHPNYEFAFIKFRKGISFITPVSQVTLSS